MQSYFIDKDFKYDGSQLRTQYAYREYGLLGDSIIAWEGACRVEEKHMKDGEDFLAKEEIRSEKMLHFLIEIFHMPLTEMVSYQRLFSCIIQQKIFVMSEHQIWLERRGDDLYYKGDQKFNISVAARGPISSMLHCAVNILNKNTPVDTCSLEDFKIVSRTFAQEVMKSFVAERISMVEASKKVFPLT